MKTALVTGDAGFIGRHMVDELLRRGYQVTGIDIRYVNVNLDIRKGSYAHITIDCRKFFEKYVDQFDLVVHCAALVGGRKMIENQPLKIAVDLEIDSAMFRWAVQTQQPRVVYYSSSAAYPTRFQNGKPPRLSSENMINAGRYGEWLIGRPDMSYGWAKLTGEYLASLAAAKGVRVHVFRPFSGYGSDQDFDYPFPSFIRRAAERADPFVIWGDGLQVRDWIHVDDVIAGTLAIVDQDVSGPVNLCTGEGVNFRQLQRLVCNAVGYSPEIEFRTSEPSGVQYRVGDPTLMHSYYKPKVNITNGILNALTYYEKTYGG